MSYDCCANCLRPHGEHTGAKCPSPYTTVWHEWDYIFAPPVEALQVQAHLARKDDQAFNLLGLYKRAAVALKLDPDNTSWFEIVGDLEKLAERAEVLEAMRPHWAKGFSSDSIAAQTQTAALSQIWQQLGVDNQTDCMQKLRALCESSAL